MSSTRCLLLWLVVTVVVSATYAGGCEQTCCPMNWLGYNGFCYRHFAFKKSWDDARSYCQNEGGDLASIHSDVEDHILGGLVGGELTWIGLRHAGNSNYQWSDGTHYHYNHFGSPQPDLSGNCIKIGWSQSTTGWDDNTCTNEFAFICKM